MLITSVDYNLMTSCQSGFGPRMRAHPVMFVNKKPVYTFYVLLYTHDYLVTNSSQGKAATVAAQSAPPILQVVSKKVKGQLHYDIIMLISVLFFF